MTIKDQNKITEIMKNLIIKNFKNGVSLEKAKDQAFNRFEKEYPIVLNAWVNSFK